MLDPRMQVCMFACLQVCGCASEQLCICAYAHMCTGRCPCPCPCLCLCPCAGAPASGRKGLARCLPQDEGIITQAGETSLARLVTVPTHDIHSLLTVLVRASLVR